MTDPEVSTGRKERADGGRDGPRGEHTGRKERADRGHDGPRGEQGKKGAGRQGT